MAAWRSLATLGGRSCGVLSGFPASAALGPARFSSLVPSVAAALQLPSGRMDRAEDGAAPNPAVLGRSMLGFGPAMPRAYSTEVTNDDKKPSVPLPPTLHTLKYPTSEIMYDEKLHTRFEPGGDASKRAFTYMILTGGRFIYASAIRLVVLKFLLSMTASDDVLAMASLEVELANIEPGQTITVKWRGKPVFVRRRTAKEIEIAAEPVSGLRDPQDDSERAVNPEWLVVVGVCTHLGCVPLANAGDYNGWFCPCHGSHYDISGRIRKGPAPYNLEVPQYKFIEDTKLLIG